MTPKVRDATKDDAALLLRVVDLASDGLLPQMWSQMAPEGQGGEGIGLALVAAEQGDFSYTHGVVVESEGAAQGGMIDYKLPATPEPLDEDVPDMFVPIMELMRNVLGYWYINFMAVLPSSHGLGYGRALLDRAEARARHADCPGLALIVAASNARAIRLYTKAGFREVARCPFDLAAFDLEPTEALLMVRELERS